MRIVLLDWEGTLGTLKDPHGFVEKLQDQGDYVFLVSELPEAAFKACPALLGQFDGVLTKPAPLLSEIVRSVEETKGFTITSLIAADDNVFIRRSLERQIKGLDIPCAVIRPEQLPGLIDPPVGVDDP